jgi:hypothetical protein
VTERQRGRKERQHARERGYESKSEWVSVCACDLCACMRDSAESARARTRARREREKAKERERERERENERTRELERARARERARDYETWFITSCSPKEWDMPTRSVREGRSFFARSTALGRPMCVI